MICPIMTKGWLSNKDASEKDFKDTDSIKNMISCKKQFCAMWVKIGSNPGFCGLRKFKDEN